MNTELHLFVLWSNAKSRQKEILADIATRFKIIGIHSIMWEKERFSANLTRFYGESLPTNSNKERHCGNGLFTLVVVLDENPLYRIRRTTKGLRTVNVNMFDSKEMYRHWLGGGHLVHGTNDEKESKHDLVLLTGYAKGDYLKRVSGLREPFGESFSLMPGEHGWKDVHQVFYILNETVEYLVLRNFSGLYSTRERLIHNDVDILTTNRFLAQLALNSRPLYKSKRRVRNIVTIGSQDIFFDIRYIGDNYYCEAWERDMIGGRYLDSNGYYRPSAEHFLYALLYHALLHKKIVGEDYKAIFREAFPSCNDDQLRKILSEYLSIHGYTMKEPHDFSVYFNPEITGKQMSIAKFLYKALFKVLGQ